MSDDFDDARNTLLSFLYSIRFDETTNQAFKRNSAEVMAQWKLSAEQASALKLIGNAEQGEDAGKPPLELWVDFLGQYLAPELHAMAGKKDIW